jgi:hypothetical protein
MELMRTGVPGVLRNGYVADAAPQRFYGDPAPDAGPDLVAVKPLGNMIILVLVFCCFGFVFGRSWAQDPLKRVRLDKWCRTHLTLAPGTNYKVISWPLSGLVKRNLN